MPNIRITEIISGGQTGVDRAALDVAITLNIPHSGWCPFGREAEDGIIASKYNLKEAPAATIEENSDLNAIYNIRTELNARDTDGTLIILKNDPIGGTLYTIKMLQKYNKPFFILNLFNTDTITNLINWLAKNDIHRLNVAGPRESQAPGIYNSACKVIEQLLMYQLLNEKYQNNFEGKKIIRAKL